MKEPKLNEVFHVGEISLKAIESSTNGDGCLGCYFKDKDDARCVQYDCRPFDVIELIFVEVKP